MFNKAQRAQQTSVAKKRTVTSLASLFCLGLCALLSAATIVLALIPLYLPKRDVPESVQNNTNDTFYLRYDSDGNPSSSLTGRLSDPSAIESRINSAAGFTSDSIIVLSGLSQTAFVRRKRNGRERRAIKTQFLLLCKVVYRKACFTSSCREETKQRIFDALTNTKTVSDVHVQVSSRQFGLTSIKLSLVFAGVLFAVPKGFGGEPETLNSFTAVNSGLFKENEVWDKGIVPYGVSNVSVRSGVTVTIARSVFDLNMTSCDISGKLILGSKDYPSITFSNPSIITVRKGGVLEDGTSGRSILLAENSAVFVFPGGSLIGPGTQIALNSNGKRAVTERASITISEIDISEVGATMTTIKGEETRIYYVLTVVVIISGFIDDPNIYMGLAPQEGPCSDGTIACQVSVADLPIGIVLTISSGLSLEISALIVNPSAKLQIRNDNPDAPFEFRYKIDIRIQGALEFVGEGKYEIQLIVGSNFYVYPEAKVESKEDFTITSVDEIGGTIQSSVLINLDTISAGIFVTIQEDGSVDISFTDPESTDPTFTSEASTTISKTTVQPTTDKTATRGSTTRTPTTTEDVTTPPTTEAQTSTEAPTSTSETTIPPTNDGI